MQCGAPEVTPGPLLLHMRKGLEFAPQQMPGPQSQLGGLVRSDGKLELSGGLTRGPQALCQGHNQIVHDIVEFKVDEKEEEVKGDVVDNWMLDKICMYFQTSWWQKGNSLLS